jgi:hypothetical protein
VYPHLRVTDDWGILDVKSGGALISADWSSVTVPAPANGPLGGEGWTIQLNEGYKVVHGLRPGDFTVGKSAGP